MKKFYKVISVSVLAFLLAVLSLLPAFAAEKAATGQVVSVNDSVTGVNNMGSMTVELHYDKDKLDLLSEDTLEGTGIANTTEQGVIIWGALFEPENGSDFSDKTDIFNSLLIAKQDIEDLDSVFEFKVRDAYNIEYQKVDASHITYSAELEKETDVGSVNENPGNIQNVSSAGTDAPTKADDQSSASSSSSASSKNASSAQKDSDTKIGSDSSSKAESGSLAEKDSESTVSAKTQSFEESEFENVPPIKTETPDEAASSDSASENKGGFPIAAVIGIVLCLAAAIAAGVVLIVKKKK